MADQGTFIGEVQRGWQRFWRLSWWWKAPILVVVGGVSIVVIGGIAGGGEETQGSPPEGVRCDEFAVSVCFDEECEYKQLTDDIPDFLPTDDPNVTQVNQDPFECWVGNLDEHGNFEWRER